MRTAKREHYHSRSARRIRPPRERGAAQIGVHALERYANGLQCGVYRDRRFERVKGICHHAARDITVSMTAHAIGNDPETNLVVAQIRVLIVLATSSDVRGGIGGNGDGKVRHELTLGQTRCRR